MDFCTVEHLIMCRGKTEECKSSIGGGECEELHLTDGDRRFLATVGVSSRRLTAKRASPTDSNSGNNSGAKYRYKTPGAHVGVVFVRVSEVRVYVMLRATQARFQCGYKRVLADLHQTR